jgi:hypothetical protein
VTRWWSKTSSPGAFFKNPFEDLKILNQPIRLFQQFCFAVREGDHATWRC